MQQLLNKKNLINMQKQNSRVSMQSKAHTFIQQINLSNNPSRIRQITDPNDVISRLLQPQDLTSIRKLSSVLIHKKRGQLLVETQERIFAQVIGLITEIDDLRSNIINTNNQIKQLNIQHPQIQQKVKFHGFTQRLSYQQCNELQQQNLFLIKKIKEIQSKQSNSLYNVLEMQKKKLQQLRYQLEEGQDLSDKTIENRIKSLRTSIAQLQEARSSHLVNNYPEFQQLKIQNENLRRKTIQNLRQKKQLQEQQDELVQYLRRQEQNRIQFMQELKKMKDEYKRLRNQNQMLTERFSKINKTYKTSSKENSNIQNKSIDSQNKSLKVESYVTKVRGGSRLSQFESVIKMMQNVKK